MLRRTYIKFDAWFKHKRDMWLQKRVPSKNTIRFNINNTFILPSSFGWSCIGIVVCLFILGTNFQNNIILLLCYFLLAMVLLAVFHSYFFFIQHRLTFLPIEPDFENRQFYLPIQIDSKQNYAGGCLYFNANQMPPSNFSHTVSSQTDTQQVFRLPLPKQKRGYHACPRITIVSIYGFGLFKCWTHISPNLHFYVYPRIQKSAINLFSAKTDAQLVHSSDSQYVISDDLQGIREYQNTDPMHHVSWKHVAKGQGMLTKDFSQPKGVSGWLRLVDLQHLDIEEALRCLCFQIQQLDKDQVKFGLDLGVTKIIPQEGQTHLKDCLAQLALFNGTNNEGANESPITSS